jgi:hypothetical protein
MFSSLAKPVRQGIAGKTDQHFIELLELIFTALYTPSYQKSLIIQQAISKLDLVKYLLQILWENKYISVGGYKRLATDLIEVGKILSGWQKSLETKTSARKTEENR